MITVQDAAIYSMNGAMAYELTYSEGTKVRAVETRDGIIRKESKRFGAVWVPGKPYVVTYSAARAAERIKRTAREFIAT